MNTDKRLNPFISLWQNIFNYVGTASIGEYWTGAVLLIGANVLCVTFAILSAFVGKRISPLMIVSAIVFLLIAVVSFVPFVSLTVRRLHAVSKSGWWAGLLMFVGVGLIILMIMCSGSSTMGSFIPGSNFIGCVYGPPSYFEPSENMVEDVYGPPAPDEENVEENEEEISEDEELEDEDIDEQEADEQETDDEEIDGEDEEDVTDEEFDPSVNMLEDVYGPPIF